MKRTILTFMAILAAITASAQINLGARVGARLNSVAKREIPNADFSKIEYKSIVCPTAGLMASLSACEWLDVQAELNYAMRGYSDDIYILNTKGEFKADYSVRTSYLELPVLAKVYPIKKIGLNLQAGPQVSCLLGRSVSDLGKEFPTELYDQLVGETRKFDCALVFGLGLDIKKWCVDFRYTHGLVETNKDWNGCKNRGISLTLGYYFK